MTVLTELRDRRVLVPNAALRVPDPHSRLDHTAWEDIHLAAARLDIR